MATTLRKYLVSPRTPRTAAAFIGDNFAVVDLVRTRSGFSLAASAITRLPEGLVTPGFESQNIQSPSELAGLVLQTAEAAGMVNSRRWSVALPEGVAKTLVISLESKPSTRRELSEVISWKIERALGAEAAGLRVSRQRMRPVGGHERYLVALSREEVVSEYEALFQLLGWQVGLLLPRHMGESQWLQLDRLAGDKILVSTNRSGFTSVIMRDGEPALVRAHECEGRSIADELYRVALYYRDRLAGSNRASALLRRLLVIGEIDRAEARAAILDATGEEPSLIEAAQFGLDLKGVPISFDQLAAAAGLATLAWQ